MLKKTMLVFRYCEQPHAGELTAESTAIGPTCLVKFLCLLLLKGIFERYPPTLAFADSKYGPALCAVALHERFPRVHLRVQGSKFHPALSTASVVSGPEFVFEID